MGDAVRERVDVAVGAIGLRDLAGEPVGRNCALAHEKAVERDHELGMGRRRDLAVIGNLADFPQPLDVGAGPVSARTSSSRAAWSSTRMSSATGARVSVFSVGAAASVACNAPIEEKSRSVLRHCTIFTGSKVCDSSACASSVSNGGQRPVVPKVPSRVARPARPAICASSAGLSLRN